ncbi:condensation domain-containing protein [Rhizobium halophytocola]|uniref:Enterobactin synthetase component F n=1 Tax=Rhizobium halophytocola TaxID=735519 RepID=A0ABS4DV58_9HYPH|nr:condensation domain-containing protein [Rhizobium halophytocola]MBP1849562.1 enterobactin synthetase component F [Rhizobium halophytocola]
MAHMDPIAGWMPLTLPQLDFWEEFTFHPEEPVSTVAHFIDLHGEIDEEALVAAVARTIREAEVLSVRFRAGGAGEAPLQICDPDHAPTAEVFDLRAEPDPMAEAQRRMEADVARPLDLRQDRLSAQALYRLSDGRYLWYIRAHHIIVDGYGLALIEQRCGQLYSHYRGKGEAGHAFHPFARFLAEEEAYRHSARFDADQAFWRDYLDMTADLPVLAKDCEDYGGGGLHGDATLPATLAEGLQATSKRLGIGWPDLLVLVSGLYLFHHMPRQTTGNGREVVSLWLPFMSRWGSVGAHMPAMLVNILPFHLGVEAGETVGGFLKRSAAALRRQRLHGRYRIEQIAADRKVPVGSRFFFAPLINVLPFSAPEFAGLTARRHILANGPGDGFNLTFRGEDDGRNLTLHLDGDTALMAAGDFERHRQALPEFIQAVLAPSAQELPVAGVVEKIVGG